MKSIKKETKVFDISNAEAALSSINENGRGLHWKDETSISRQIHGLMTELESIRDTQRNILRKYCEENDEGGIAVDDQGQPKLTDREAYSEERRQHLQSTREIEIWPLDASRIGAERDEKGEVKRTERGTPIGGIDQGERTTLSFMIFTPGEIQEMSGEEITDSREEETD